MELGYVPLDRNGSAGSLTLEYAYDDWTIYNTALLAGNRSVADTYKKACVQLRECIRYLDRICPSPLYEW